MPKKKYLRYFFTIIFLSTSCAHFQNRTVRSFQKKITTENLSEFPNDFETQASKIFVGKKQEFIHNHKNISLQKLLPDGNSENKAEYVNLSFSDDTISFHFYKNTEITEIIKIEAKLKRNGFIKLKNTVTNCQGIPYLFGGCDQRKLRIGFTDKRQLMVQEAVSNTGAFLIIFGTGYSFNAVYIFDAKN